MGLSAEMKVNFPYTASDTDRHGNVRIYYRRKPEPKVRIRAEPGTEAFQNEYDEIHGAYGKPKPKSESLARANEPGSLRWLVVEYKKSTMWTHGISKKTRQVRAPIIERFLQNNNDGDKPYARLEKRHMLQRRDAMAATPAAANTMVKVMKQVFEYAKEYKGLKENPCDKIKALEEGEGYHCWTQEEIAQYRAFHKVGTSARLALELGLEFATRISDVHRLGPQFITAEGTLKYVQEKNRYKKPVTVEVPIPSYLQEIIEQTPTGDETYLVTVHGKKFNSSKSFSNRFRKWCDQAGLPMRCSMHGLRKAGSVDMAEGGATPHQIMSVTGHQSLAEVERYTKAARQKQMAATEIERREKARAAFNSVPLSAKNPPSGTHPEDNLSKNNAIFGKVAARRGVEPLFSG